MNIYTLYCTLHTYCAQYSTVQCALQYIAGIGAQQQAILNFTHPKQFLHIVCIYIYNRHPPSNHGLSASAQTDCLHLINFNVSVDLLHKDTCTPDAHGTAHKRHRQAKQRHVSKVEGDL